MRLSPGNDIIGKVDSRYRKVDAAPICTNIVQGVGATLTRARLPPVSVVG